MCACYTEHVKNKFIIKAFTFYILNFRLFYMCFACMYLCTVCVPCPQRPEKSGYQIPRDWSYYRGFWAACVLWELFLVALKCSAFSPTLYFLRHSCLKRMCSGDWPGTQASICLWLPSAGIKFIKSLWIGQEVATLTVLVLAGSIADCSTSIP